MIQLYFNPVSMNWFNKAGDKRTHEKQFYQKCNFTLLVKLKLSSVIFLNP